MTLPALALRHARGIVFLALAAAAAGLYAGNRLPKGVYPEVTFEREQVVATLPGAPASKVLVGVTRPLEAALAAVPGVERVRSRTIRGAVEISLFFAPGTRMVEAHPLVLARLAEQQQVLPPGTELVAERVLPSSFPILSFNVEGPYAPHKLYELAQYTLKPALTGLAGVGLVTVQSSDVPEVQVLLDPSRLESARLTVPEVADRLRRATRVDTVARVNERHELALGVVDGEAHDPATLAEIVVGGTPEAPVRLRDVGRVVAGTEPRTALIRVDGRPGAILNVTRRAGGDTTAVDREVHEALAALGPSLLPGVTITPVYEQASFVAGGVRSVEESVLLGALLAVLVLGLFLRDLRATLLAAASLPLTLAASLLLLAAAGQSLNLMSLGGLAVAVGLVIDDAVVVIEAVHRHLEAGHSPQEAARRGTEELFWPVVGTTATTVVVFLPLGLLTGVAGQFFAALSFSLAGAVLLSLPVALLVLPAVAGSWLRPVRRASAGAGLAGLYARGLAKALGRPWLVLGLAAAFVLLGGFAGRELGTDFLPEADEGAFVLDYFAPVGASLEDADALASEVEAVLREVPEVATFSRRLGAELGPPVATLSSRGDIVVRLKNKRDRDMEEVLADVRTRVAARVPGLRIELLQILADMLGDLEGSPEPVEIKIFGPDPAVLRRLAADATSRVRNVQGLVDLFDGDEGCAPELDVRLDPAQGGRQGLDAAAVADQLSSALLGEVATQLREPDHLVGVRVRLDPSLVGGGREALEGLRVVGQGGVRVPLNAVSRLETSCPPAALLRDNLRNMVHVTARLSGTDLGAAATEVRRRLSKWNLPLGYSWRLGGLSEQQQESFASLLLALAVALAAVFAVLLFQLRSVRHALTVLAATPLALAGGLVTLWLADVPLNVSSLMGAILLVGLVVKNGILLLDHAIAAEERGLEAVPALLEAAEARLRPILMTTLATLVALVPLVLGLGASAELHRPLAITVVGGLAFSTAGTLFLVPVLASLRRVLSRSPDHP